MTGSPYVPVCPPHPGIDLGRIDAGKIAVLTAALANPGATVVLDDLAARGEADRLVIPKIGTLRLLLDAKQLGIIPSILTPSTGFAKWWAEKVSGTDSGKLVEENRFRFLTHFPPDQPLTILSWQEALNATSSRHACRMAISRNACPCMLIHTVGKDRGDSRTNRR